MHKRNIRVAVPGETRPASPGEGNWPKASAKAVVPYMIRKAV